MDMQLKELRRELRGEQQTYHQMTFSEAKLAEKLPGWSVDTEQVRSTTTTYHLLHVWIEDKRWSELVTCIQQSISTQDT